MPESYDDLIGKPWALGESGPDSYDCFGLACTVLERLGYEIDTIVAQNWIRCYVPGEEDPEEVTSRECSIDELPRKPGDLVVMRGEDSEDRATHIAVHIGENLLIQSCRGIGVHIVPFSSIAKYCVEVISWTD